MVKCPEDEADIRAAMADYEMAGLPGAFASVDCVHIVWDAAAANLKNLTTNGKN